MNTILGELGKNPKFCEYIKNIENIDFGILKKEEI